MSSKITRLLIAAGFAVLAGAPAQVATARQSQNYGQYIDVEICNKTGSTLYVALSAVVSPGSDVFYVEGWKVIEGYACGQYSLPRTGWFYYYAEDGHGKFWGDGSMKLCVQYPGPFRTTGQQTCSAHELKEFSSVNPEGRPSFAVDLNY